MQPVVTPSRSAPTWSTLSLMLGLALAAASLAVVPSEDAPTGPARPGAQVSATEDGSLVDGSGPAVEGGADATSPGGAGGAPGAKAGPGTVQQKAGLECAPGKNGGNTAVGVSATSIKLGATVADSGIGASFLGDVRYGMQAVADKVNRAGGICGRRLDLKLVDDGWDYTRGGDFIRNLVQNDKVFALAVVPSSEGLLNVSKEGYLKAQKVPVVGSDGMLINQYTDPYIWPVAASTVSTMHIMVKQAYDAGARQFAIVYETTYHFGIEGAYAFNAAVKRLTQKDIDGYSDPFKSPKCDGRFCGIPAGGQYNSEINSFTGACKPLTDPTHCDLVALLLEPTTALNWMRNAGSRMKPNPSANYNIAGPQPLFTYDFAKSCGEICHDMTLWTGFYPPLGDYLTRPAVATYVEDVKSASRSADFNNSFVEGGYLGMQLLVKALRDVGPNLTRENLKAVLDNMDFDFGLSAPMKWRQGNHFANTRMRAFSIQYRSGTVGWRDMQIELEDPWVGQDGGH